MSSPACPICEMTEILDQPDKSECVTCGHEWAREAEAPSARIVKDTYGTFLIDGDAVTLIKDLTLMGPSEIIKGGTKVKGIRLVDGDHETSRKIDGGAIGLKACFVKKA